MYKKIFLILCVMFILNLAGCDITADPEHEHKFENGICQCGEIENVNETLTAEEVLEKAYQSIVVPKETDSNIELLRKYEEGGFTVYISWKSDNLKAINNYGYIKRQNYDQTATLIAKLTCNDLTREYQYNVTIFAYDTTYRLEKELESINVDTVLTETTALPKTCKDSEIQIEWTLSHPKIFDNNGVINFPDTLTYMNIGLKLSLNGEKIEKEYVMAAYQDKKIQKLNTQIVVDSDNSFADGMLLDLVINSSNNIVLADGKNVGTYVSPIVETSKFDDLVGSWSAITNQNTGSVEVFFRVLVDDVWSDYFTYGEWRLGDQNKGISINSSNGVAKMDTDTIIVPNGKYATAYQYKVEFKRINDEYQSPELRVVAAAFKVSGYEEVQLDYSKITQYVCYDVPQLNQNIVPGIGNSICSPTSTTMLLKYYGHSFVKEGFAYEHQYVASLAKDYGQDIYGNWVYNVAVMGAYGEYAYVKRFINNDELIQHLENVGPVALSVKGNMQGYYTTAGHLIVCKGYKVVDGEVIFICNDPNIKNVEVEYTYETIENVWREIAYVIEGGK